MEDTFAAIELAILCTLTAFLALFILGGFHVTFFGMTDGTVIELCGPPRIHRGRDSELHGMATGVEAVNQVRSQREAGMRVQENRCAQP